MFYTQACNRVHETMAREGPGPGVYIVLTFIALVLLAVNHTLLIGSKKLGPQSSDTVDKIQYSELTKSPDQE